jgi:hypothetical protein
MKVGISKEILPSRYNTAQDMTSSPEYLSNLTATTTGDVPMTTPDEEFELKLANLDLEPIVAKLISDDGPGWTLERADRVAAEYRKYLALNFYYPGLSNVTNREVDEFWHTHILDTYKYAEDCQNLLGRFLHHFPYFGLRGEQDKKNLDVAFSETKQRIQSLYPNDGQKYGLAAGCDPTAVRAAGCDPTAVKAAGCDPTAVRAAGCDPTAVKAAGCDPTAVRAAGCDPTQDTFIFQSRPRPDRTVRVLH